MKNRIILLAMAAISLKAPDPDLLLGNAIEVSIAELSFWPLDMLNNELRRLGVGKKTLTDSAKRNISCLQGIVCKLRPPYNLGDEDSELETKLKSLEGEIKIKGLFGYKEDDMLQLEVASQLLKDKPVNEDTARAAMQSLNKNLDKNMLGCLWVISDHFQIRKSLTISPAQGEEIKYICEKFEEVAKCLKRLCKILDPDMQDIPELTMVGPEILDVD